MDILTQLLPWLKVGATIYIICTILGVALFIVVAVFLIRTWRELG